LCESSIKEFSSCECEQVETEQENEAGNKKR